MLVTCLLFDYIHVSEYQLMILIMSQAIIEILVCP